MKKVLPQLILFLLLLSLATRAMNSFRNLYKAHYKRRYGEDELDKLQFRLANNLASGVFDDIERLFAFHDSQQSQTIQHIDPGAWRIPREIVNYGHSEGITRL